MSRSGRKPSLTAEAVQELRRKAQSRRSAGARSRWLKQEAQRLGSTPHAIDNAVRGKSYRWVQ